ncbi:MAG: hypothetical protein K2K39_03800 [Clostridia bacterium]|nr:hypothetical protein [Clostridia bacterium]
MEEEKSKCHKCYNCGNFTPYYKKGDTKFSKVDVGGCRKDRTVVEKSGTCKSWMSKRYRYKNFCKVKTEKALRTILSQLSEIRQIIEEAQADE